MHTLAGSSPNYVLGICLFTFNCCNVLIVTCQAVVLKSCISSTRLILMVWIYIGAHHRLRLYMEIQARCVSCVSPLSIVVQFIDIVRQSSLCPAWVFSEPLISTVWTILSLHPTVLKTIPMLTLCPIRVFWEPVISTVWTVLSLHPTVLNIVMIHSRTPNKYARSAHLRTFAM